jgi:hypothetical protein
MNTKAQILDATRQGLDVFNYYMPVEFQPKKKFKNPFYQDGRASCYVYLDAHTGSYRMKDFGAPEFSGDCFWLVALVKGWDVRKDFARILSTITQDLMIRISPTEPNGVTNRASQYSSKPVTAVSRLSSQRSKQSKKKLNIIYTSFSEDELAFWGKYGICENTLNKYDVRSVGSLSGMTKEGRPYSIISSATEPIFAYHVQTSVKIYRPNSQLRFLYASPSDGNYVFGMSQLPPRGNLVFITGGEKDVMSLAAHGFYAVCFNSETASLSEPLIETLCRRFKHVVLLYDMDETGIKMSNNHLQNFSSLGLLRMDLPLSGSKNDKDISDYFAKGATADDIKSLFMEVVDKMYANTSIILDSCELDYDNPPDPSKTVVGVNEVPVGTYDNLLCITGGEGVGKSHYVSAIISGAIANNPLDKERTLGLSVSPNKSRKAVLLFDTEQSESQLYKNVTKALRRAYMREKPDFFHAVYLTALSRKERLQLIKDSMDLFYHRHNGIHLVVIDGIADLIRSANDETESVALVDELYRLAGIYNTCIVCVLHFVPNGIKLRGHIGSELQRKAAGILSIEKEDNQECSLVKTLKVRDGSPLDIPLMLFGWDKENDMFVYRGEKSKEEKDKWRKNELSNVAKNIFRSLESASYGELVSQVESVMGIQERTAKKYISQMKEFGIIKQDNLNNYKFAGT